MKKKPTAPVVPPATSGESRAEILDLFKQQSAQINALSEMLFDAPKRRIWEHERTPLPVHLVDFRKALGAKGSGEKHVRQKVREARLIMRLCRAGLWAQLTPSAIQTALNCLIVPRPIRNVDIVQRVRATLSLSTVNHYLASIKGFCNWMVADYRANRSPCLPLKPFPAEADIRRPRRPLPHDVFLKLIAAANAAKPIAGIPGYERAMGYLQAATTGLRSAELQSLTSASFRLDSAPQVCIEAAYAKNGHKETVPLRADVAAMLRTYLATVGRDTELFRRPKSNAMRSLREDLEAAGIPYKTAEGFADFHALRHTFISDLFNHQATPPEAQKLARHRTAAMTSRYAHSTEEARRRVIERLPSAPTITYDRTDAAANLTQPGKMDTQHARPD
jgi:integrase